MDKTPHAWGLSEYKPSKSERIKNGIQKTIFINWYKQHWDGIDDIDTITRRFTTGSTWLETFYFKLPWRMARREYFDAETAHTLKECIALGWIEEPTPNWINLGTKVDAWTLSFPLLSFLQFCEKNKIAWAIVLALIGYSPLFREITLYWLCFFAPLIEWCNV